MALALPKRIEICPGVWLWPEALDGAAQAALIAEIFARVEEAPFYRPVMPGSGKPFSVEETNFGSLGWLSDSRGYRYGRPAPGDGQGVARNSSAFFWNCGRR